ncbi:16315_t:CDS:2, partial [Dentiscutata erythropus]
MSVTPPPSAKNEEMICLWKQCNRSFEDPELLYQHLANDHVGRKSTGNLCLKCHWDKCEVQTTKRDHITSHLRVHVPLKPHVCPRCRKAFKRPQDLKKHEKIHSEEHQASILGKNNRHKNNQPPTPPQNPIDDPSISYTSSPPQIPPSPESETSDIVYKYQQLSGQEILGVDYANFGPPSFDLDYNFNPPLSTTNIIKHNHKRSVDFVDEFIQDVKRNKVDPQYSEGVFDQGLSKDNINLINYQKEDLVGVGDFMKHLLKDIEGNDNDNELNINSGSVNSNIYPFQPEEFSDGSLYPHVDNVNPPSTDVEHSALSYTNSYPDMVQHNISFNTSVVYPMHGLTTPYIPQGLLIWMNQKTLLNWMNQKNAPKLDESKSAPKLDESIDDDEQDEELVKRFEKLKIFSKQDKKTKKTLRESAVLVSIIYDKINRLINQLDARPQLIDQPDTRPKTVTDYVD